ncbi:MAG TPA: hypothetical protein VFS41_00195 [Edaphobacter sp.]|nr:hypothetical protein [Edaphobacter sp.]
MTPLIGFRTNRRLDQQGSVLTVHTPAIAAGACADAGVESSRVADYAYRIAAVTAGLVFLATVM